MLLANKTLIALLAMSWVAASESLFLLGTTAAAGATAASAAAAAVTVAGIAALKGAIVLGAALGEGREGSRLNQSQNRKRSIAAVQEEAVEQQQHLRDGENLILATIERFDPDGCIFKLLCHLQVKDESSRTIEENLLVRMFSNNTDIAKDYNAAFVNAAVIGGTTRDDRACSANFPHCPLSVWQLESLIKDAWGCGR
ncbi:uncharacterized protein LOC135226880 [Macrobrachium nipponense]|uniref:uncharacterized protein LOC135226880 n=1 Tax=Macrobrachium nipponense TaxID=159736 RepID=UPI0030C7ED40